MAIFLMGFRSRQRHSLARTKCEPRRRKRDYGASRSPPVVSSLATARPPSFATPATPNLPPRVKGKKMEASPPRRKLRPPPPPGAVDSLPPEILQQVLSFLPLRDAVRTSAVSRAWRRLWESAPGLALEWRPGTDAAVADGVLARYSGPVRSFEFVLHQGSFWRADGWVPLLAAKGVQILKLHFGGHWHEGSSNCLGASIFSCRELTSLDLADDCVIPAAPPGLAGFPKLTKLRLSSIEFPDSGVRGLEALIAESPLLEELLLDRLYFTDDEHSYGFEEWVIRAPNLRSLRISTSFDYMWQIIDSELPSVEDVEILTGGDTDNRDFMKLFTGLARARKLHLEIPYRDVNALEGLSCTFENLKDLSLRTKFCSLPTMLCKICILKNAPNLEALKFLIMWPYPEEVEVGVDLLNAQWIEGTSTPGTSCCCTSQLSKV
ncbi:unnamed protein product [Urochloa decumbens]|uniref:F-box domain-containing protein n=1 Tax=Urochloa decumbens TaxID=240449 RepID=A0ABC9C543_9POAL